MLIDITARQVPQVRAEMLTWLSDPGPQGYLRHLVDNTPPEHRGHPDMMAAQRDVTAAMVRDAELFFVSSALTTLARGAGASLPEYRLHPEDLPAPVGWCAFGDSLGRVGDGEVQLAVWAPARGGVTVEFWADSVQFWADAAAHGNLSEAEIVRRFGPLAFMHAAAFPWRETPRGWGTVSMTAPDKEVTPEQIEQVERAIVATWLLMGQTLTHSDQVHAPRSAQRRVVRAGAPLMPVRYTDLRRVRTVDADHSEQKPAGPSRGHQWVVRGLN